MSDVDELIEHSAEGHDMDAAEAAFSPPSDAVAEAVAAIRAHHRTRVYAMEQRKRADLSMLAFLRMFLGWRLDAPKEERDAIAKHAMDLRSFGENALRLLNPDPKVRRFGKPDMPEPERWREIAAVVMASLEARKPFDTIERSAEKEMERLAKSLPVWRWAEGVRGLGAISLAVIVGEAGDIGSYPKKGHLWKRMGLAVLDGVRQGGLPKSAKAEQWIAHGYNRQRRSRMYVIGDVLVKCSGGPYREVYLARKQYEREMAEAAGLIVAPSAKIPKAKAAEYISDGHVARRSQRYMEKRLLRDLWREWRAAA